LIAILDKDFLNHVAGLQFDLLLIDFIDERLNLYVEPGRRICTLSSELLSSGFCADSKEGAKIYSGSEEFWHLWEAGWEIFLSKLRHLGVLGRVRINQVFWGVGTKNGGNFEPHFSSRQIDIANKFLDRLYQRARVDFPSEQFLRFDEGLMMGAVTHKWGVSPFHYDDAYYHAAIQQLTVASAPSLHASGSFETQLPGGTPLVQRDRGDNKVCLRR